MPDRDGLLKQIPQVDKLMQNELISNSDLYRHEVTGAVRDVISELREGLMSGTLDNVPHDDELAHNAVELATKRAQTGSDIRRVINGTGVILHSNLGRACLSKATAKAVVEAASSYCTLEYDIIKGERGNRTAGIEKYLRDLTGCEASLVVNNNAAAVLLMLSSIAGDGTVIVSRGELVEIGGGFRVPDIISQCGCLLKEVGTTNKTRVTDFAVAIDYDTKAILKVHPSNFKIIGFTETVTIKELASLGQSYDIPVLEDIGSGALSDVIRYGLKSEPIAKESLENGADVVSFSADKLLGGLQCGIILGREKYISAMKKHPLYRALRVDKITIAALEATLRVYADPVAAERDIPVLTMLSLTGEALRTRAEKLCEEIRNRGGVADVIKAKSVAGGGAVPGHDLESYAVAPVCKESTERTEERLRELSIPIIGYIDNDRLLIDVRTIFEEDFEYIINAVTELTK